MVTPDARARSVLDAYLREVAKPPAVNEQETLQKLVAGAIRKALIDDRTSLREKMECDSRNPCAFESVCSHHKALAGAMLRGA